ncbi:MAG: hypothetical protein EXR58_08980 [Chloroflexi bacterium]|nr:hypothetical protein [Chloroflexota bacterium]
MLFRSFPFGKPSRVFVGLLFAFSTLAGGLLPGQPALAAEAAVLAPVLDGDDRWGFNHVTPGAAAAQVARNAGARWNRWEFRWEKIQPQPDQLAWTESDQALSDSLNAGLSIQAVLIGLPSWAPDPATGLPQGLYLAWDDPGNSWGRYVREIVTRYRGKIRYWEVWNEPDAKDFWSQPIRDYYQLLKVSYQAIKSSDPAAQVLLGGLDYWHDPTFLDTLLGIATADPEGRAHSYFFDVIVWHVYSRPAEILDRVAWSRGRLKATVGDKPIWLNETNVPVWNESPFNDYRQFQWSATTDEQASFIIQAFAYSVAVGVDRVVMYRFQDVGERQSWGIVRADGTLRPAYTAFQVATEFLSFPTSVAVQGGPTVERIEIHRGGQRISVVWNRTSVPLVTRVPASYGRAEVIDQTGTRRNVSASNGGYELALAPATANMGSNPGDYIIGGPPLIVVEASSQLQVDHPTDGIAVGGMVAIDGWAVDQAAATGTGVDMVNVYLDGPSGTGAFLGSASYGANRPEAGSALGSDRFRASGWRLQWDASQIRSGQVHTLHIYAHSTVTNAWFSTTRTIRVGFADDPGVGVDNPKPGERVAGEVAIRGWAADRNSPSGTGVDAVHVYLDGPSSVGRFLGAATYGSSRSDVAASLGSSELRDSGWNLTWNPRGVTGGNHQVYIYAHSILTGTWSLRQISFELDQPGPVLMIDRPAAEAHILGVAEIAGWAADPRGQGNTGVDTVQLFLDGGPGAGAYLGEALYGATRPDVALSLRSPQFINTGWSFAWNLGGIPEGRHVVHVLAHSSVSDLWTAQTRNVVVEQSTIIGVDAPAPNTRVSGASTVLITGWAVDRGATAGTGVDMVHIYLDGPTGVGAFVGPATYGAPRPDVAAALGSPRFTNSGWSTSWLPAGLAPGEHVLYIYAYSNVTSLWALTTRTIQV